MWKSLSSKTIFQEVELNTISDKPKVGELVTSGSSRTKILKEFRQKEIISGLRHKKTKGVTVQNEKRLFKTIMSKF